MALIITWLDLLPADRTDQKLIREKKKHKKESNEGEQHL